MTYTPGTMRLKVLLTAGPDGIKNWPFPLTRDDKQYLMTNWADPGTFSDLDTATDAEIQLLWDMAVEAAE